MDATYKRTWNNLPLLVFGSSDADRRLESSWYPATNMQVVSKNYLFNFKIYQLNILIVNISLIILWLMVHQVLI